jgi:hypothetical protein
MTNDGRMLPIDEIVERGLELKSVKALQPLLGVGSPLKSEPRTLGR